MMAQQSGTLATKPDDLIVIPGTHVAEGPTKSCPPPHIHGSMSISSPPPTRNKQTNKIMGYIPQDEAHI